MVLGVGIGMANGAGVLGTDGAIGSELMYVGTGCPKCSEYSFVGSSYVAIKLGWFCDDGEGAGSFWYGGVQSTYPKQVFPGPQSSSFLDGHGSLQLL